MIEKKVMVKWKNGEPSIPLYYLENMRDGTDTLVVYLHGAASRENPVFPYYNGRGVSGHVDASFILFSDPMRFLDETLDTSIGWYCSPHEEEKIITTMSSLIKQAQRRFKKVLIISGSAGGIPSVRICKNLEGVFCFVWNPQTDIQEYYRGHIDRWKKISKWSKPSLNEIMLGPELYVDSNYYWILQKGDDTQHFEKHFVPLCKSLGITVDIESDFSMVSDKNILLHVGNWSEQQGHVAVPRATQISFLQDFVKESNPKDKFNTNYFRKWDV